MKKRIPNGYKTILTRVYETKGRDCSATESFCLQPMKPKRHILDFGERVCPECRGRGMFDVTGSPGRYRLCKKCKGDGTIQLLVAFDLWETCPGCGGFGDTKGSIGCGGVTPCHRCNGTGETPKYWTPEEAARKINEVTGEDWEPDENEAIWTKEYGKWDATTYNNVPLYWKRFVLLRFRGQPAPPADYRIKEN